MTVRRGSSAEISTWQASLLSQWIIAVSIIMCNLFSRDAQYTLEVLIHAASLFISTSSCLMMESCKTQSSSTMQFLNPTDLTWMSYGVVVPQALCIHRSVHYGCPVKVTFPPRTVQNILRSDANSNNFGSQKKNACKECGLTPG